MACQALSVRFVGLPARLLGQTDERHGTDQVKHVEGFLQMSLAELWLADSGTDINMDVEYQRVEHRGSREIPIH